MVGNKRLFSGALTGLLCALLVTGALCSAAQARSRRSPYLRVGVLEEPKSLNIWLASDAWSNRVLSLIYQPLYLREPKTQKLVPWLAAAPPQYDPANLTYTVTLRPAKWSDGHPLTSADVVFTVRLIRRFKVPRFYAQWSFLKKVEALGERRVRFWLERPRATFLTRSLTTPVVSRREWQATARRAQKSRASLMTLLRRRVSKPLGCGPFVLKQRFLGVSLFLTPNRHFFGRGLTIAGLKLGPRVPGIILKPYGIADVAVLALKRGDIDMYWNEIQPGYVSFVKSANIRLYRSKKNALYFLGFNLRRPPFNDPALRKAVELLVDKRFLVRRVLHNSAIPMHSLVPPANTFWLNPKIKSPGAGLSRRQRILRARSLLRKAGYTWDQQPAYRGKRLRRGDELRLPGGKPMDDFAILTPPADYDPHRAMAGIFIQEWLQDLGIPAYVRPMAFSALIRLLKMRGEFACFVLGYGRLSQDPGYLRTFFHSSMDRAQGWNLSGYKSAVFDRLADASEEALDVKERQRLVRRMQVMLMRDLPYLPLYNPLLLEAVRSDSFTGWIPMVGGIGNLWSFCTVRPVKP